VYTIKNAGKYSILNCTYYTFYISIVNTIIIVRRKKNWSDHVMKGEDCALLREVMEGRIEEKRPRGRKRMGMLEELL